MLGKIGTVIGCAAALVCFLIGVALMLSFMFIMIERMVQL